MSSRTARRINTGEVIRLYDPEDNFLKRIDQEQCAQMWADGSLVTAYDHSMCRTCEEELQVTQILTGGRSLARCPNCGFSLTVHEKGVRLKPAYKPGSDESPATITLTDMLAYAGIAGTAHDEPGVPANVQKVARARAKVNNWPVEFDTFCPTIVAGRGATHVRVYAPAEFAVLPLNTL